MKQIMKKYLGQEIGMNLQSAFKFESVTLQAVEDDHFTVVDHKDKYVHHFSYFSIVQMVEGAGGVVLQGFHFHKKQYKMLVKVGHLYEHIPG